MADPRVVVGSVWRNTGDGKKYAVTSIDDHPNWPVDLEPYGAAALDMRGFEYVSGPASPPKVEPPDWNRWLPPAMLPDRGEKKFKAGQVWAYRGPRDNAVFRVRADGDRDHDCLASTSWPTLVGVDAGVTVSDDGNGRFAILVQDTDETSPRDPDVLYGRAPAVPMALVGERWRWPNGSLEMTITGLRVGCHCDEGGVSHVEVETEGGGVHCPVLIAKLCTRISPAPQQPAPAAATRATCKGCGSEASVLWEPPYCCKGCRLAAAPEVVPEAPTEPAQLPEVRRHDFGNPYVANRLGRLCVACGTQDVFSARNGHDGGCVPVPGWREAHEAEIAASMRLKDERARSKPDTRPVYRPLDLGRWASDPRLVWQAKTPRGSR